MLRISVQENANAVWLVLEGRLVGPWVDELKRVCQERRACVAAAQMNIDLCGLTAMDTGGQQLLDELLQSGATIRCSDVMNQYLVEQMAKPTERSQEACRPCRRFPSRAEFSGSPSDAAVVSREAI